MSDDILAEGKPELVFKVAAAVLPLKPDCGTVDDVGKAVLFIENDDDVGWLIPAPGMVLLAAGAAAALTPALPVLQSEAAFVWASKGLSEDDVALANPAVLGACWNDWNSSSGWSPPNVSAKAE